MEHESFGQLAPLRDPWTLGVRHNLVLVLQLLGEEDAARTHTRELLTRRRPLAERPEASSIDVQSYVWTLLDAYPRDLGGPQAALAAAKGLVARFRELNPEGSIAFSEALLTNGIALNRLGRHEEAEKVLGECAEMRRRVFYPEHPETARVATQLGEALAGQGRFAEAEPLLLESYDRLAEPPYPRDMDLQVVPERPDRHEVEKLEALERVIALYESWGRKDESQKWREKRESRGASR